MVLELSVLQVGVEHGDAAGEVEGPVGAERSGHEAAAPERGSRALRPGAVSYQSTSMPGGRARASASVMPSRGASKCRPVESGSAPASPSADRPSGRRARPAGARGGARGRRGRASSSALAPRRPSPGPGPGARRASPAWAWARGGPRDAPGDRGRAAVASSRSASRSPTGTTAAGLLWTQARSSGRAAAPRKQTRAPSEVTKTSGAPGPLEGAEDVLRRRSGRGGPRSVAVEAARPGRAVAGVLGDTASAERPPGTGWRTKSRGASAAAPRGRCGPCRGGGSTGGGGACARGWRRRRRARRLGGGAGGEGREAGEGAQGEGARLRRRTSHAPTGSKGGPRPGRGGLRRREAREVAAGLVAHRGAAADDEADADDAEGAPAGERGDGRDAAGAEQVRRGLAGFADRLTPRKMAPAAAAMLPTTTSQTPARRTG